MPSMNAKALPFLALAISVHALPQVYPTVNTAGLIPQSELASYRFPTAAPAPTATSSSRPLNEKYSSASLTALWQAVQAQGIPVQNASITEVVNATSFVVPETPRRPRSLMPSLGDDYRFPKGFLWGVASSAQQSEGAVMADGRGPSHWDYACHILPAFCNNYTADITANHYYLYKQDIARIKAMGVNAYSFSISWTRIFPFGNHDSPANEAGLKHYDDVIDELVANNIEPAPVLFHWDTPLNLIFEYGGFMDPNITRDFANYAETVFRRYGDRVTKWITFNEPNVYCAQYGVIPLSQINYPGTNSSTAPFVCTHNVLKAHGMAVKIYRDLIKNGTIPKGEIGFKNAGSKPLSYRPGNADDEEASDRAEAFEVGIFSQPVYGDGNYPKIVRDTLGSVIPNLTEQDKELIKGSADFYAIDAYRTSVAKGLDGGAANCSKNPRDPDWPVCQDHRANGPALLTADAFASSTSTGWAVGGNADPLSPWLQNTAPYLRDQLKYFTKTYPSPKIYISEFGFAEPFESQRQDLYQITWDAVRTAYCMDMLTETLLALKDDGIPLAGAFAWAMTDNFEWVVGLQQRFGLQHVNYTDPNMSRTYKLSFLAMRDFFDQYLEK